MKRKPARYDYGECAVCDTRMEERHIRQDFWIRGKLIVVQGVPAGVCPRCGERVVKAEVGRRIMKLMQDPRRIAKAPRISVPAIKFDLEEAVI